MGRGPGRGARSTSVHAVLCLIAIYGYREATASSGIVTCKPQGFLRLDAPYEPPASRSPALPFCKQFSACTCCNASHAAALAREVGAALADDLLSAGCKAVVAQLACRVCDPLVGTGRRPTVCLELCDTWLASCQNDYFEWYREELLPCRGSVVCSRLGALARTGAELCASAGLAVAASACYDGRPPGLLESCRAPPARARRRKAKRATKPGAAAWASEVVAAMWERLMVLAGTVCACVVWRMAAARWRSTARVHTSPAPALPWGADARFPGRGRFLNE